MTVGHVARPIESIVIPTVCIYIEVFRPDAELLKPARTLITPHLMGRPPGLPHRNAQQRTVIQAALRLLEQQSMSPRLRRSSCERMKGGPALGAGDHRPELGEGEITWDLQAHHRWTRGTP